MSYVVVASVHSAASPTASDSECVAAVRWGRVGGSGSGVPGGVLDVLGCPQTLSSEPEPNYENMPTEKIGQDFSP